MMERNSGLGLSASQTQDVVIDLALLRHILREGRRSFLLLSVAVFVVALLAFSFLLPQTFTSSVSLSLQQPTMSGSGLSALLGMGGSGNARYIGVLKSLRLAKEVEAKVHLREFYHLTSAKKANDKVKDSIKAENSPTDSLLYIRVSLPGPPRFGPGTEQRRQQVEAKAAQTANAYADALRRYMQFSDTDKDAVLLREAENKLHDARQQYDAATELLADFVRGNRISPAAAAGSNQSPGSPTALTELNALYVKRGTLATEIKSAETAMSGTNRLLGNGGSDISQLPAEDPLLTEARAAERDAEVRLKNLRVTFGEENPQVIRAREQLQIARADLAAQAKSIQHGQTTDSVRLDRLKTELAEVNRQIDSAEQDFKTGRNAGTHYELLRNEVELRLAALKEYMTHYAELKLQTVAAQNRLSVIDPAVPAEAGTPSLSYMAIFSLFITLIVLAVSIIRRYLRLIGQRKGKTSETIPVYSEDLAIAESQSKKPLVRQGSSGKEG